MIILYVVCPFSNWKPHLQDWCTRIKHLNLYMLLWLNESNLKLIFTCLQIQISQLNNQESQSYPRLSALVVFFCPVWFSSHWLKERDSKIWQINNEIFYTISWDSSQIYGCTLRDIMMQTCWARNKTIFPFLTSVEYNFHLFTLYFLTQYVLQTKSYKSENIYRQDYSWHHLHLAGILFQQNGTWYEWHSYLIWMAHNMHWLRISSVNWKILLWLQYSYYDLWETTQTC